MSESEIDLRYRRVGRQGMVLLTIVTPDGKTFTDKVDVAKEAARAKLLDRITEVLGQEIAGSLAETIEETANQVVEDNSKDVGDKSQADELVDLAGDAYLFHTPGGYDSEGYAAIVVGEHRETWSVGSNAFKRWLAKRYHDETGKAPNSSAIDDALTIIAGRRSTRDRSTRSTSGSQATATNYLDLGDPGGALSEMNKTDWRVISGKDAPVWFHPQRGILALPVPVNGGKIDGLRAAPQPARRHIVGAARRLPDRVHAQPVRTRSSSSTVSRDRRRARPAASWSASSTRGRRRCAGPQSARSHDRRVQRWLARRFRQPIRRAAVALRHDLLARRRGFAARELYTDDDEKLFDAMRPVLLNWHRQRRDSLGPLSTARVHLHLPSIPEEKRAQQRELGTVRSRASARPGGPTRRRVRRTQGSHVGAARAHAAHGRLCNLGDGGGTCARVDAGNVPGGLLRKPRGGKRGGDRCVGRGPRDLDLHAGAHLLGGHSAGAPRSVGTGRGWESQPRGPRLCPNPAGLSRALRRVAPNLRASGLVVEFLPREGRRRPIRLARGSPCQ